MEDKEKCRKKKNWTEEGRKLGFITKRTKYRAQSSEHCV